MAALWKDASLAISNVFSPLRLWSRASALTCTTRSYGYYKERPRDIDKVMMELHSRKVGFRTFRLNKKSRANFDGRFPIHPKDVGQKFHQWNRGGSKFLMKKIQSPPYFNPQPTGYYSKEKKRFVEVKEMIPEFIVPDLTDCELKPYVPYSTDKPVTQSALQPLDLFRALYAPTIQEDFEQGKYSSPQESDKKSGRHDD